MSDDTTPQSPPVLRWFSAGIRFFAPVHSNQPYFFPVCLQAAHNQDAIEKAWNLFRESTYDKEKDIYQLPGDIIIVPFHIAVVDCTDWFLRVSKMRAMASKPESKPESKKPKRKRPKSKGNVIDLFPKDGKQQGNDKTDDDTPPIPPKKE